jgi:hypothetical protein
MPRRSDLTVPGPTSGARGPLVGGVARLTSPAGALIVAAGAVAGAGVLSLRR